MSVKIIKNSKSGQVVTTSNNPEYGYVVAQTVTQALTLSADGTSTFLRPEKRTAIISGRTEDLNAAGYFEGMELADMKIIHMDSLEEKQGFSARTAGEDGPELKVKGQTIYRKSVIVPASSDMSDAVIQHDNGDEIRAYNEANAESVNFDEK